MEPLHPLLAIHKALGDATRLRALALLAGRELCLCQLLDVFAAAPSTLSKHMAVLAQAGLVEQRRQGRWRFFRRLRQPAPAIRAAYRWVDDALAASPTLRHDLAQLARTLQTDLTTLCGRYEPPPGTPAKGPRP